MQEAIDADWSEIEWKRAEDVEELNDGAEGCLELFKSGEDGDGTIGIEPNDI